MLLVAVAMMTACDDTTDTIGISLENNMDNLQVSADTFSVSTRSIVADSVYSRNTTGYLGRIRDPETGVYISGDFMTQFHTIEDYTFPSIDSLVSIENGLAYADSCEIRLYYNSYYGDSLATMKLTAMEMSQPMLEDRKYYSNFDPETAGYIRTDGIKQSKVYTLCDHTVSEDVREDDDYGANIRIPLNQPYTDKDGVTYNNFGTFLMRKYYENPDYYKNSLNFINQLVPGFYFKNTGGLGSMAYIYTSQLNVFFRYNVSDSTYTGTASFAGTEEVLQQTRVNNEQTTVNEIVADNSCTYLKTPAGVFTEVTLPVDEILQGHESDSINTAKIVFTRINNSVNSDYQLDIPQTLIMIPTDSLYSFFEHNDIINNRTSYYASYSSSNNTYTFNNIATLINTMNRQRNNDNWNKVVLVPVELGTITVNNTTQIVKVIHDMSLTSTRLVGGSENVHEPVKISVIYSRFK